MCFYNLFVITGDDEEQAHIHTIWQWVLFRRAWVDFKQFFKRCIVEDVKGNILYVSRKDMQEDWNRWNLKEGEIELQTVEAWLQPEEVWLSLLQKGFNWNNLANCRKGSTNTTEFTCICIILFASMMYYFKLRQLFYVFVFVLNMCKFIEFFASLMYFFKFNWDNWYMYLYFRVNKINK